MTNTLFKEVSYSLSKLIQDIDMGEIGLPDIQQPFVWRNTKVHDLFDSMYKGSPIGYLLFWENGLPDGHRQIEARDPKGFDENLQRAVRENTNTLGFSPAEFEKE